MSLETLRKQVRKQKAENIRPFVEALERHPHDTVEERADRIVAAAVATLVFPKDLREAITRWEQDNL